MTLRWKLLVLGLLLFQWVQALVFWHLMDVVRLQAEGSWLHETAWGPETMRWVWVVGSLVTVVGLAAIMVDVHRAVPPPASPSPPPSAEQPPG